MRKFKITSSGSLIFAVFILPKKLEKILIFAKMGWGEEE